MSLTPAQMADILFQKPGRVTDGVLAMRSPLQKLRDEFQSCSLEAVPSSPLARAWSKNKVIFYDTDWYGSAVVQEHPRSFRSALKELKAYGFSIPQMQQINDEIIYDFWMFAYDEISKAGMPLAQKMKQLDEGRRTPLWASKAFLGVSFFNPDIRDGRPLVNSCFDDEAEGLAYSEIIDRLEYSQRQEPSFFIPAARTP